MADREKIVKAVEYFYIDIIEKYKELEKQVASESRLTSIFKKVDYKSRINKFKELKKKAQNINLKAIPVDSDDEIAIALKDKLNSCIPLFCKLIDAQVALNLELNKKNEGKKMEILEYKKAVAHVKECYTIIQKALNNLDVIYADLED